MGGAEHEFGRTGIAAAQKAFERGEQPLRRKHQLRSNPHVGRQFDARGKARRRLVQRLRIGARTERAVEIVEARGAEALGKGITRQAQQVTDRGQAEGAQGSERGFVPLEHGERQRGERVPGAVRPLAGGRDRYSAATRAGQREQARATRRGRLRAHAAVAELGQPGS